LLAFYSGVYFFDLFMASWNYRWSSSEYLFRYNVEWISFSHSYVRRKLVRAALF